MSSMLAPPAPPPADPTGAAPPPEGTDAPPSGAPPDTAFAPLLAAAQGPPGSTAKPATRTATAGGDQAGSDSSAPTQEPDAGAVAQSVDAALVLAQVPAVPSSSAGNPASGHARRHTHSAPPAATGPVATTPLLPPATVASAPNAELPTPTLSAQAPTAPSPQSSGSPATPLAGAAAPSPAAGASPTAGDTANPAAVQAPPPASTPSDQSSHTSNAMAPQAPSPDQGSPPPATPAAAQPVVPPVAQPAAPQQAVNPVVAAIATPPPATQAQTAATAAPLVAQVNDVSPSKGGDARRSRNEAGAAEQHSRFVPAASEPSTGQTATVQDASATKDVDTGASAAEPPAQPSVRLAELAQAAQTAITVTSQNGGGSARIVLHPEELGTVQIHLRYSSDGVTATIRADSPQAAQVLHQAAPDLRRALEGQGLSLLDLDVRDQSGFSANDDPAAPGGNSGGSPGRSEDSEAPTDVALDPAHLRDPGSQIDVLA